METYSDLISLDAEQTFHEVAQKSLQEARKEIGSGDTLQSPKQITAKCLESQLVTLYGMAAAITRREDDIGKIAQLWKVMTEICDEFSREIETITGAVPARILYLRQECQKLHDLHRAD